MRTQRDTLVLALTTFPAASRTGGAVEAAGAVSVHLLLRVGVTRVLGWRVQRFTARVHTFLAEETPAWRIKLLNDSTSYR